MQIILLIKGQKKTFSFSRAYQKKMIAIFCSVAVLLTAYIYISSVSVTPLTYQASPVATEILAQRAEIERVREKTRNTLDNLALRVGQMQAQLMRLNAVGEHLVKKAKITSPEFNFDQQAAIGGAELAGAGSSFTQNQLLHDIDVLAESLSIREKQLKLLDVFSSDKKLSKEVRPAGLPVEKGWLSSFYGYRADPFTGRKTFHHGVDIAGKSGTNVLAAASGLVTWTGEKSGYGYLIEIDHGSGYQTRYAHNKAITVKTGDVVKQGEVIAKMGSTGRSTGPHVHFEVLRHGKKVNPRKYLYSSR